MSATYNFVLQQGTTFSKVMQYIQGSDGEARDLTDYSIASQFRLTYDSTTAYNFTASFTTASEGLFKIELSPTGSTAISASDYVYDIEISSGSYVERILEGIVTISPEATTGG